MSAQHTPGPWRWEFNEKHRSVHLVGGDRPHYDLTILEPSRWSMHGAGLMIRDTAHDGMNIMHKLNERKDWIAPFPGRSHHAHWCANVVHPDMRLIAAAPDLLAACKVAYDQTCSVGRPKDWEQLRAAIAKADGDAVGGKSGGAA